MASLAEFSFSELIQQPTRIASVVEERGRVVLRRRNAPDLVLSQAGDLAGLSGFARLLIGALHHLTEDDASEAVSEGLPWTRYLSTSGRREFLAGLPVVITDCDDLGTFAPLEIYLSEWRATAAVLADPELADRLSRPIPVPTGTPVKSP